MSNTTARLEAAVCGCGHFFDDHRCAGWDVRTGRIDLAECLDATCPCTRYALGVAVGTECSDCGEGEQAFEATHCANCGGELVERALEEGWS